jgi:hypothetical protein
LVLAGKLVPFNITTVPVGPTLGERVNAGLGPPGGVVVMVVLGAVVAVVVGAVVGIVELVVG